MWQDYDLLVYVLFSLSLFLNQPEFVIVFHGSRFPKQFTSHEVLILRLL